MPDPYLPWENGIQLLYVLVVSVLKIPFICYSCISSFGYTCLKLNLVPIYFKQVNAHKIINKKIAKPFIKIKIY